MRCTVTMAQKPKEEDYHFFAPVVGGLSGVVDHWPSG